MIKTIEELTASINTLLGENPTEEGLALLEDVTDTFNANNGKEWREKYESLSTRYRNRFLTGAEPDEDKEEPERAEPKKYADLFK